MLIIYFGGFVMFLIKKIVLSENSESVLIAEDGIRTYAMENPIKLVLSWGFWGPTEVVCGDNFKLSVLPKSNMSHEVFLTYANSCEVEEIENGNRKIMFFVDEYQTENIEGYIVFIDKVLGTIRTNGQKIGGKYNNEMVVILREGKYLQIEEHQIFGKQLKTVEVIDGKLITNISKV